MFIILWWTVDSTARPEFKATRGPFLTQKPLLLNLDNVYKSSETNNRRWGGKMRKEDFTVTFLKNSLTSLTNFANLAKFGPVLGQKRGSKNFNVYFREISKYFMLPQFIHFQAKFIHFQKLRKLKVYKFELKVYKLGLKM